MSFEANDGWLIFAFWFPLSVALINFVIYPFHVEFQIFDKNLLHFFLDLVFSFPHPQAWFHQQRWMLVVGTGRRRSLLSWVVSLIFLQILGNFPATRLSALVVWFLLPAEIFIFAWFSRIMFIWCFWCWWCCCATLLLSVVEVSLFFSERDGKNFHIFCFAVVFVYLKCFLCFVLIRFSEWKLGDCPMLITRPPSTKLHQKRKKLRRTWVQA